MQELFDLSGNVALCTGASSGIGRRMAYALSAAGSDVVLVGRRKDKLDAAGADIADATDGRTAVVAADLFHREGLADLVAEASSHFGAPTILVNAAGINLREPYDEITLESWDRTINLNLATPFFLARACVAGMRAKARGKIINIASLQSNRAFANSIPYGASKGGIAQLTRAMAEAWSADGILTNAIAPGFFETGLTAAVYENPAMVEHNARMTAIGRNGLMEDLDGVTVFLASRASDYITGQVIPLDGGYSAK
jgi:gluconate 5-dehydrogenase